MVWAVINLTLSFVETAVVWISIYCFMKVNDRNIFRKKLWYPLSFFLAAAGEYAVSILNPGGWGGSIFQLVATVLLGALLFRREVLALVLDILFSVMLFLGMECGIFIFNIGVSGSLITNYAKVGSMGMAVKIVIMILMAWLLVRWRKGQGESPITLRQAVSVLVLPAFSAFFLYSLIQMMSVYVQLNGMGMILVNIVALLLLNIYFLYLFQYLFRAAKLEQELQVFQAKNEVQYRYYGELERKYQESRKVFHDMKNHLQAVEQLYEEKNKEAGDAYVKDLYHMINVLGEQYYSSNHMLNIILNEKLSMARRDGIQVKTEIGDADFDDLKDVDITAIFANLLDNAIEAARELQESAGEAGRELPECAGEENGELPEHAWIEIRIDEIQAFRVIHICNARKNDSEKKKHHMGLGLVNVRHTLEKYHGSLELDVTETEYRVSVMIPGKE